LRTIARASAQRCCWPPESCPGPPLEEMPDAHARRRFLHRRGDLRRRRADHLQRERDVVEHRHVRIERVALEHHRDVAVARREQRRVGAVEVHEPVGRGLEARNDAQRRRLARTGRPEQREELPRPDLQVDVAQHVRVAERLADTGQLHLAAAGHRAVISGSRP
jgi:hypothetical protein